MTCWWAAQEIASLRDVEEGRSGGGGGGGVEVGGRRKERKGMKGLAWLSELNGRHKQ